MPVFPGVRTAVLAAISHGTNYPAGQQAVKGLVEQTVIKAAGSESVIDIQLGHVDVQQPDPESVLSRYARGEPAVLVPLLLSAGFHVNVDLREAADAAGRPVVVAGA
jgi:sirohydrochlorin ferrochelatase